MPRARNERVRFVESRGLACIPVGTALVELTSVHFDVVFPDSALGAVGADRSLHPGRKKIIIAKANVLTQLIRRRAREIKMNIATI